MRSAELWLRNTPRRRRSRAVALAIAIGVAQALASPCDSRAADPAASRNVSAGARTHAKALFEERCAVCHGVTGDGHGPGAESLAAKPVNFHDRKWQQSVSDEKIAKVIVQGGTAAGLSAAMASNPDLENQPEVVAALVQLIRKFGK